MKKVIFLLLFPLMAEVVISCCNCIEPVIQHYTNKTITLSNLDNSAKEPVLAVSDTVVKKAYGIRLQLIREKMACLEKRRSLFISSAYAFTKCSCPPAQEYRPKDSIVSIKIYTLQSFDNDHAAGSDLSAYFKVYKSYAFSTLEQFVKTSPTVLFDDKQLEQTIDFLLMTAPAINIEHHFKVQLTLSDGRTLEGETSPVKLI